MSWRRRTGSLRARLVFVLSALLILAVAPSLYFLARYAPLTAKVTATFVAVLLLVQYVFISRFTRFIAPLKQWAHEFTSGKNPMPPVLATEHVPELREINRLLREGSNRVGHHLRALDETRELLEHNESRLDRWRDKTLDILFELDAQGNFLTLNSAWQVLTGFPIEQSLGKALTSFILDDELANRLIPGQLSTQMLPEHGVPLRAAHGHRLLVNIDVHVERDANGNVSAISGLMRDVTETVMLNEKVSRYEDELYQLSVIDPLTGLYNRQHFDNQLETILADHIARARPVCLLLIDLDGFKFVNDTYGHPFGDEVLRTMTQLLRDQVRRNDYLARLAGDEFAMVLKNTDLEDASRIAKKLHTRINETGVALPIGRTYLQASIGVVEAPTHASDAQGLVSAADVALYHGRRHGRNRVETLSPDMSRAMISVFGQGFQLRRALDAGDIHPAFQPIYDMERGQPVAYEVLARMRVNDSLIQAKDFIGVAQELGLTRDMDLHVIHRALSCAPPERALFLNVDLQSFNDRAFVEALIALLKPACENGRHITIEITERETLVPDESLRDDIQRLRQLGCKLALDDFGSGYSTYKFLELFRPDYLKIEGSFVRDMLLNESSRKIVAHIHELARSFDMETIAESVENEAVEQALRDIGIRNAQGMHFGCPSL